MRINTVQDEQRMQRGANERERRQGRERDETGEREREYLTIPLHFNSHCCILYLA